MELKRFEIIRGWAKIGGIAAIIAALGGLVAAWPVVKGRFN
jgi:hypothetical protein